MGLEGENQGITNIEKMKQMLNHENIKKFCIMLEEMLDERKSQLYNAIQTEEVNNDDTEDRTGADNEAPEPQ